MFDKLVYYIQSGKIRNGHCFSKLVIIEIKLNKKLNSFFKNIIKLNEFIFKKLRDYFLKTLECKQFIFIEEKLKKKIKAFLYFYPIFFLHLL